MKLYDYYRSSACYRVRIALNIKGISYEAIPVHLVKEGGQQHHPEYQSINPQQLVPTLNENGHILTQSISIIEYLNEINPEPALLPSNPLARAQVRGLAFMIACDTHPINNLRILERLRQQFNADDADIKSWYHHWLRQGFDAIEAHLNRLVRKKPVCFGEEITLADVCLIPQVYNAKRFHFSLAEYPIVNEINDYCLTLPEFLHAAPENDPLYGQ